MALATAGVAAAHGVGTPHRHAEEDSVILGQTAQRRLNHHTRVASGRESRAAAAVSGTPDQVGKWGPVVNWPVVPVFAALLPNGKVLAYDSVGDHADETYPNQTFTRATVWDPATGSQTNVRVNTGYNLFCSGLAHLVDGTVFVAGGNKDQQDDGIVQTHLFDPATDTWSLGPDMAAGRWYPTVTPLPDGEMLITSGGPPIPEVRTTDGSLRSLSSASLNLPLYPWTDVAPDGQAFVSGPDPTMRDLDTAGEGHWTTFGNRDGIDRSYGSHAMYDIGKILVAGGGPSVNECPRDRHQRSDSAGLPDLADGVRPPPVQPDRLGRRKRPGHRRKLVRRVPRRHECGRLSRPSCGTQRPATGRPSPRWPSRASTTRPRSYSRMGGCCRPAEGSAGPATRSATWPRTPRSSHRPTCTRRTARDSWLPGRRSARRRTRRDTARRFRSGRPTPPRSRRSRSCGSAR